MTARVVYISPLRSLVYLVILNIFSGKLKYFSEPCLAIIKALLGHPWGKNQTWGFDLDFFGNNRYNSRKVLYMSAQGNVTPCNRRVYLSNSLTKEVKQVLGTAFRIVSHTVYQPASTWFDLATESSAARFDWGRDDRPLKFLDFF